MRKYKGIINYIYSFNIEANNHTEARHALQDIVDREFYEKDIFVDSVVIRPSKNRKELK